MPALLYLHGLASSPKGRKADLLLRLLSPEGFTIAVPDLNVPSFERLSFESIVERAARAEREARPDVVVGSSLGALVALSLVKREGYGGAPLVLIAPALAFRERWRDRLPDGPELEMFHHGEGRELPIHREFFEGMASVSVEEEPPPVPVQVLMGTDDESVPYAQVAEVWHRWESSGKLRPGSRFRRIERGDHGLVGHGEEIVAAIRELLAGASRARPGPAA